MSRCPAFVFVCVYKMSKFGYFGDLLYQRFFLSLMLAAICEDALLRVTKLLTIGFYVLGCTLFIIT